MFLETDKVKLRQIEQADLPQLRDWRNDPKIRSRTRGFTPLNLLLQDKWWNSLDNTNIMFGIVTDHLVGACGLVHINWKDRNAELSYYIGDPGYRGKGIGRHVAYLLFEYGFHELNMHKVWGEIYANAADIVAIDQKLGFTLEATMRETYWYDGKWWDSHIVGMLEDEWEIKRTNYLKESDERDNHLGQGAVAQTMSVP